MYNMKYVFWTNENIWKYSTKSPCNICMLIKLGFYVWTGPYLIINHTLQAEYLTTAHSLSFSVSNCWAWIFPVPSNTPWSQQLNHVKGMKWKWWPTWAWYKCCLSGDKRKEGQKQEFPATINCQLNYFGLNNGWLTWQAVRIYRAWGRVTQVIEQCIWRVSIYIKQTNGAMILIFFAGNQTWKQMYAISKHLESMAFK